MGILFVPIALALKLVNLLLWLVTTALKLAWRFVALVLAMIGSIILAVIPGKKKGDRRASSNQEDC